MNDERLTQELERRADSGSSRPEWVRRDLLPFVRHETAARPQPVVTSRWAPGLSVAAVIAALLILVIAVPRLTPQPPAATPSPDASTVLSSQQFSDGLVAGTWQVGQTFLVQGRISFDSFAPDGPHLPQCDPPDGVCALAILDGTPVHVVASYTPTTDAPGSGVWAVPDGGKDYHFPSIPIEGVLVLRMGEYNEAEFVGLVHGSRQDRVLSVADAAALDPAALGPDQAVLVRGYLVDTERPGEFIDLDCIPNPYPLISGLPNRYCVNTDFISSEAPDDSFGRNGDRLTVQGGAADAYAANFQAAEALYAIAPRLYGGGCAGPPPCWLWNVVARLDGPRTVSPAPTISPEPLATEVRTLTCVSSDPDILRIVQLTDRSGIVESCTNRSVSADERFGTFDVSRGVVEAIVETCAGGSRVTAEISARIDPWPGQRPYLLSLYVQPNILVDQSQHSVCVVDGTGVGVELTFMNAENAPDSLASLIDTSATTAGVTATPSPTSLPSSTSTPDPQPSPSSGVGTFHVDGSPTFELHISASKADYTAGEPIDVSSYLVADADVTIGCPTGPLISLQQIDGPLTFTPGPFISVCPPDVELQSDAPRTAGFLPAVWGLSTPNPLEPYIRNGKLYLPKGTYLFVARAGFDVGMLHRAALEAHLGITVR